MFVRQQPKGDRLLPVELTQVVRRALQGVVEQGTASRLNGAFKDASGNRIIMGGKTGTGDQRYKTFGAGGNLLTSRVVNRTATMVFFLGDRFFGTMTAFVPGEEAANYRFTSSLPAQLLKAMSPALSNVLAPIEQPAPGSGINTAPAPRPLHAKPARIQAPQSENAVPSTVLTPHTEPDEDTIAPPAHPDAETHPALPDIPAPEEPVKPKGGEAY